MKDENAITLKTTLVKTKDKKVIQQPQYSKGEEIFNFVSHVVGGVLGVLTLIYSMIIISNSPSTKRYLAMVIFSLSIIILYTISAMYHILPQGKAKRVFRIFDHCTIFLLIAGTYTPFCLIAFDGLAIGTIIFIIQWSLAILGITLNAINMNWKAVKILSMISYLIMGWCIILTAKILFETIATTSLVLLIIGGVAYTVGVVFYSLGKKVRYFHSVWHLFVVLGTLLQVISILMFL